MKTVQETAFVLNLQKTSSPIYLNGSCSDSALLHSAAFFFSFFLGQAHKGHVTDLSLEPQENSVLTLTVLNSSLKTVMHCHFEGSFTQKRKGKWQNII